MKAINDPEQTFQNVCRACMKRNGKTHAIFDQHYKSLKIIQLLISITPQLQISSSDPLPKSICADCLEKLNIAYKFQEMCIATDNYMRYMLAGDISEQKYDLEKLSTARDSFFAVENHSLQTEKCFMFQQSEGFTNEEDPLKKADEFRLQEHFKVETSDEELSDFDLVKSIDEKIKTSRNIDLQQGDISDIIAECSTWRKRKTSKAWLHFTELRDEKAKCNFCDQIISFRGGNPYNLTRHLKTKHPHILNNENFDAAIGSGYDYELTNKTEAFNQHLSSVIAASNKANNLHTAQLHEYSIGTQTEQHNKSLVNFFAKEYLPCSLVESKTFRKFVNELGSNYELPNCEVLSNILEKYYSSERENIHKLLDETDNVALTLDRWTSVANIGYISIYAHFLDKRNELKSCMLICLEHSDNLNNDIESICHAWNLIDKVEVITCHNIDNVFSWKQIPCFVHTLNEIAELAFKEIKIIITKIRTIVKYYKLNTLATKKLKDMEKQVGIKLKLDIAAHWYSTIDMLQCFIEVKEIIASIKRDDFSDIEKITDEDLEELTKAYEFLSIIKDVKEEMSSDKKATLSQIILVFNSLKNEVNKFLHIKSLPETVRKMAMITMEELTKLFENIDKNCIFGECIILDPRFKKYGFTNQFAYHKACLNLKQLATNSQSHTQTNNIPEDDVKLEIGEELPPPKKLSRIWDSFDREVNETLKNTSPEIIEIDKYLQEPILQRSEDPFKWWYEKKEAYPRLYQLVRQRMCVSPSAVIPERIFEKADYLLSQRRHLLTSREVSKIEFLNYNMQ